MNFYKYEYDRLHFYELLLETVCLILIVISYIYMSGIILSMALSLIYPICILRNKSIVILKNTRKEIINKVKNK